MIPFTYRDVRSEQDAIDAALAGVRRDLADERVAQPGVGAVAEHVVRARHLLEALLGRGVAGVLVGVSTLDDHTSGAATAAMLGGYVVGFIALFLLSGIGNGSVYKMIPSIFEARSRSLDVSESERAAWSRAMSGALIGFAVARMM